MGSQLKQRRKIIKIGNSIAITIPHVWLKANDLEAGDIVAVIYDFDKLIISVDTENGKSK